MKAAIVGCGGIARVHAKSLSMMEDCTLVAFADIVKEKAEDFVQQYGGNAYSSLEEMLACEKFDILHICTPHYLHVPMAISALRAGINVFTEKPPVISYEQLAELEAAVAATDKKLGICFQNRYNQCTKKAKELIASGKAGAIKGARGLVTWSRDAAYYTESGWRGTWATEGGGVLINQSIHTLDLLLHFLGKPVMAEATMSNHHLKDVIEVEDTMEAYVQFEDAIASFYATTAYCTNISPLIEIECENVRIRIEDPDVTFYFKDGRVEKPQLEQHVSLGKSYWGSSHAACIADFHDCVKTGRHFHMELPDMEDTIRMMLAVYESAKTGKPVSIQKGN